MSKSLKKISKAISKSRKKQFKGRGPSSSSGAVKFSEGVKGLIYLILALSLFAALFFSNSQFIVTRDDLIGLLFGSIIGKIVLVVLGIAFLIYGLKHLGLVR
ncbi:MAG: DUF1206 domain-containing protein [archaeon]